MALYHRAWRRAADGPESYDRSSEEMGAVGMLTRALANTSSLTTLKVKFRSYPAWFHSPTSNLANFLPIQSLIWSKLVNLELKEPPFNIEDIKVLTDTYKNIIRSLKLIRLYLQNALWRQFSDILRQFTRLESIEIVWPRGGGYPTRSHKPPHFPRE